MSPVSEQLESPTQTVKNSAASSFEARRGPLFVIGMWRSGTSLLYRLINQHPQISLMYEGDLAVLHPLFFWFNRRANWMEHWDFWSGALRRHSIDRAQLPANPGDVRTAVETVYRDYAGSAIWGCKSPSYFDYMVSLHKMFPDARFIIIWRDPADVCRSVLRAGKISYSWFNRKGMFQRGLFGCRVLKSQYDALLRRGAHVHPIEYDDLVRDTAGTMTQVCEFLNLPYDERMASLKGGDHSAIDPAGQHEKVKGDRIVVREERSEILTDAQKHKIASYVRLWREESGGRWPRVYEVLDTTATKPSLGQRAVDWTIYRFWRTSDTVKRWLYCFAPLGLLNSYRKAAGRPAVLLRQAADAKQESKAKPSVSSQVRGSEAD